MEQELRRLLTINGEDYLLAVSQFGSGPPSGGTLGKPSVLYLDTSVSPERLYICTAADVKAGTYTWKPIESVLNISSTGNSDSDSVAKYNEETGELLIDDASYDESTGELTIKGGM